MEVTKFRIALYGLLVRNGKILMTETKVPSGSFFNFPGGGLELGEAPRTAMEREFVEETGLVVDVARLIFCSEQFHQNVDYRHEQVFHVYYEVAARDPNAQPVPAAEILQLGWFSYEEMPRAKIWAADLELLQQSEFKKLFGTRKS